MPPNDEVLSQLLVEIRRAIDMCTEVYRIRTDLIAIERRIRELRGDTPIHPSAPDDAKKAFENAAGFLKGKKESP